MGYVSHKGDRGHDSAEPVSSEGEGARTASPKVSDPLLATCRLGSPERALEASWRSKEGEGASSNPREYIIPLPSHMVPAGPPLGGCKVGDGVP